MNWYKLMLPALLLSTGPFPTQADDLDAALEAQKRIAQRRVYSESAFIEDQNLTVPRPVSAEERELDRKLRERDARDDNRPSLAPAPFIPAPQVAPQPAQDRNWLTPALLDDSMSLSVTETEDDWILRELDRQKDLKAREASVLKENETVDRMLRERTAPPREPVFQGTGRLDLLQPGQQSAVSGVPSSYTSPRRTATEEQPPIRPARREMQSPSSQPYSSGLPASAPASAGSSLSAPSLSPYAPPAGGSSGTSGLSPDWHTSEPAPLTPAQMIRKSAPINRADPFKDDLMPRVKSNIWE